MSNRPGCITVLLAVTILLAALPALASDETTTGEKQSLPGDPEEQPSGNGKLGLSGSYRLRTEHFDGFNIKGYGEEKRDTGLYQRIRLQLGYRFDTERQVVVMLQDSRFRQDHLERRDFGESCPYENPADLRKLYFEWRQIAGTPWGFTIGRQAISFADKHLFGPGDWGNVGRYAWDAARLQHYSDRAKVDLFYARRVLFEPERIDSRHHDFEVLATYLRLERQPIDLFVVSKLGGHDTTIGESGRGSERRLTFGAHFNVATSSGWDVAGTVALQRGSYGQDDLSAYGYHGKLGYRLSRPWQPRVSVEYTAGSGDRNPSDGSHETFDNVFGSVDSYYGRMNLFAWKNLEDLQLGLEVKPGSNLSLSVEAHSFRMAQCRDAWYWASGRPQWRDQSGAGGTELGRELDLRMLWQLTDRLELMTGVSFFDPGRVVKQSQGGKIARWLFMQVLWQL